MTDLIVHALGAAYFTGLLCLAAAGLRGTGRVWATLNARRRRPVRAGRRLGAPAPFPPAR
ncbi:hypothetical protein CCR85_13805 [Rhodothalassium salexigens]|uniref:hypothetical protein n=1 Tax=Rhodothalassium salexigens TaxID=1086 RepID=UPI001913D56F|nr:hypothetical protein [Rhodothalassium salexigens]MBK5912561.1 hypothetical protein [Rhodothalassium salexigens]MBK5920419.1 hypothetical protein [Rhodothalassium salexigens]